MAFYEDNYNGLFRGGTINGYEYVDLGLSVKWATCNLGAAFPADYGCYFAWGETKPKFSYDKENCPMYGKFKILGVAGIPWDDAARSKWGGKWRMPTDSEIRELINKCRWVWTTQSGVNGYDITGATGNSIFLPAAGRRDGSRLLEEGKEGYYWSGTPKIDEWDCYAYDIFISNRYFRCDYDNRYYGQAIRPVCK